MVLLTSHDLGWDVNAMLHALCSMLLWGHGHVFVLGFMIRDGLFCFLCLTTYALRFTIKNFRYALCAMRSAGCWSGNI